MASTAARTERPLSPFFWPVLTILGLILVTAIFISTQIASNSGTGGSRDSQVVHSITREEQVVLLSLGIQGIRETQGDPGRLFGLDALTIPWSERTNYIQYQYRAKLGIEGGEVQIEPTGEKQYRITIPKFVYIGQEDPELKVAVEDNGLLSWTTPPLNNLDIANDILNSETKDEHLAANQDMLREQAQSFYNGILKGIDPEITAEYVFTD